MKTNRSPVMIVEGLNKAYGGQIVLKDLSLTLHSGEIVILRGNNGCGKTTLLNILTGNLKPDKGIIRYIGNNHSICYRFPRPFWVDRNPLDRFTPEYIAALGLAGRSWQDIRLFSAQSLIDNIAVATPSQKGENPIWPLIGTGKVVRQERQIVANTRQILAKLGLKDREKATADMVSLGQAKRVGIARSFQTGAKVLFLDEPLSGLDHNGIEEVLAVLHRLARANGVSLVIIEHAMNMKYVLPLADTLWRLENGRIVNDGTNTDISKSKLGPSAPNKIIREILGQGFSTSDLHLPGGACLSVLSPDQKTCRQRKVLHVEKMIPSRNGLSMAGVDKNGSRQGLSFSLTNGQIGLLQAPNGWGKTTLLEAISGVLPDQRGVVTVNGREAQRLSPWKRAGFGLEYLQSRGHLFNSLSVRETFSLAGIDDSSTFSDALLDNKVMSLSGGEKQLVAITRSILRPGRNVFLMDEPFAALDEKGISLLGDMMKKKLPQSAFLIAVPNSLT